MALHPRFSFKLLLIISLLFLSSFIVIESFFQNSNYNAEPFHQTPICMFNDKPKILKVNVSNPIKFICENTECPFRSQYQEDKDLILYMMSEYLSSTDESEVLFPYVGYGNLILEMGALDGLKYSNSYFFEMYLGWKTIHFEASKRSYDLLKQNRPKAINFNLAGCDTERMVNFTENDRNAVSGIVSEMSELFKNMWHSVPRAETKYSVLCVPISKYITTIGVDTVDVFFLDVEGAELSVLKGFDFSLVKVHYLIVEMDGSNPAREEQIETLLSSNGFRFVRRIGSIKSNRLYVNIAWNKKKK